MRLETFVCWSIRNGSILMFDKQVWGRRGLFIFGGFFIGQSSSSSCNPSWVIVCTCTWTGGKRRHFDLSFYPNIDTSVSALQWEEKTADSLPVRWLLFSLTDVTVNRPASIIISVSQCTGTRWAPCVCHLVSVHCACLQMWATHTPAQGLSNRPPPSVTAHATLALSEQGLGSGPMALRL